MVMGIKNSTTLTFTAIIPKTERINASVWPIVKATLKVQFFQSLKKEGTAKAIKIKHDRRHICLKRVLILFESKSKL
jgi:hypothetical protein